MGGVGKSIAEKCAELIETGELPQLKELLEKVPESVLDMLRVPGLGPKRAAILFNDLGISTLDQLKAACEEGRVRELKGFGKRARTPSSPASSRPPPPASGSAGPTPTGSSPPSASTCRIAAT